MSLTVERRKSTKSGRQRVCDEIERMIVSGELQPGQKLPQHRLAAQFAVALSVIRESLLELAGRGLVEVVENVGVFVAEMDAARILEAFEIREIHEGLAARLCCQRASRENLAELESLAENVQQLASTGELDAAAEADRRFHQRILEIANNTTLTRLARSFRVLSLVLTPDSDLEKVRAAHAAVLTAIRDNLPDAAEQAMRVHIRSARTFIEAELGAGRFTPSWLR